MLGDRGFLAPREGGAVESGWVTSQPGKRPLLWAWNMARPPALLAFLCPWLLQGLPWASTVAWDTG